MPSPLQQPAAQRKLVYFGLILGLFVVNTFFWRGVTSPLTGNQPPVWTVSAQAKDLDLTEETQGEADLLGSTVRLGLTGSRGLAVTILWRAAIEKQKRNEWNELEFLVRSLTKLQPHFLTPWLFQSWNLAYNVSVENDRVSDKYFYISRGIELLAQGERLNRDNPDMRFWLGFYYLNKFGVSDEQNTLRSLLQMSNIEPSERDPNRLRPGGPGGQIDQEEFRKFCEKNPQLVRRLREHVLKPNTPTDLVDFLADNRKLPCRYFDPAVDSGLVTGKAGGLTAPDQQFPILPTQKPQHFKSGADEPTASDTLGDSFCNYQAARAWFSYAQDPLPDPEPMVEIQDRRERLRNQKGRRLPRQPAEVIFRQYPARAESFVGERLQKEGWFDESGWAVDAGRSGLSRWFPGRDEVIGQGPQNSTAEVWNTAYNMWREHGTSTGVYLDPTQYTALDDRAREFRERYKVSPNDMADAFRPDLMPTPSLRESLIAHRKLFFWAQNRQMTNFDHHFYRADAERDRDLIQARKLMYEADQYRKAAEPERAADTYQQAFDKWKSVLGRENFKEFRGDQNTQEESYEAQLRYLEVASEIRGPQLRPALIARDVLAQGMADATGAAFPGRIGLGALYGLVTDVKSLPLPLQGPFEGLAPDGRPWIAPSVVVDVRSRLGLGVPETPAAPPAATAEPPTAPPQ
jgi:hypothetical protein